MSPALDTGKPAQDTVGVVERCGSPDGERPGEELVTELVGPTDRAEGGVQDRDPITEPLGLFEAVRRQEGRHTPLSEADDQLVDLARRDRVEAGGRLVEEEHLRVAEQCSREGGSLSEPLRQAAARVVCSVGQVHREQDAVDTVARVGHLVEVGEASRFSSTLRRR